MTKVLFESMSVELNGRTFDPVMEEAISIYMKDFMPVLNGLRNMAKEFPLSLEPAPVYSPE